LTLDIPIELSLWGAAGLLMMVGTKLSAVSIYPNFEADEFPVFVLGWNEKNPLGLLEVDFGLYFVEAIFKLVKSVIDIATIMFGLTFYCIRLQEYGGPLGKYSHTMWWDIAAVIVYTFGLIPIAW